MSKYHNPAATADVILEKDNKILLVQRKHPPFENLWALPGGHLDIYKETLERCGCRELFEETNLVVLPNDLELVTVKSDPKRDPRDHYITHVYFAKKFKGTAKANDDAKNLEWFPLNNLPKMAFDHYEIITKDYFSWREIYEKIN